jgi:hypothetical protein
MPIAIYLIIFEVQMNILFIIKVTFLVLIKWLYRAPSPNYGDY